MSLSAERYAALKTEGRLPSPKGLVTQIVSLCDQADTNVDALVRVINGDPALVGRLLRLINSPLYQRPRPAAALDRQAVLTLGVRTLRSVVLALGIVETSRHVTLEHFDCETYWSHALLRALLAQQLAGERVRVAPPTEAFTLGLLCDIGRLGLAAIAPCRGDAAGVGDTSIARAPTGAGSGPPEVAASRTGGASTIHAAGGRGRTPIAHDAPVDNIATAAELTRLLLADWGLPALFVDAAAHLESPACAPFAPGSRTERLMWLLVLCQHWCTALLSSGTRRDTSLAAAREAAARLQLHTLDSNAVSERTLTEWRRWSGLMALGTTAVDMPAPEQWAPPQQQDDHVTPTNAAPDAGKSGLSDHAGTSGKPSSPTNPGKPDHSGDADTPLHVMLVDDDPALHALLRNWLVRNGFRATVAENGDHALALADRDPPHVAIIDWSMPGMDGIALARTLRARFSDRALYLIMLTAHGNAMRQGEAFDAGFDDYLEKPVSPALLAAHFKAAVRAVRTLQALQEHNADLQGRLGQLQHVWQHALRDPETGLHGATFARDFLGYAHAIVLRHERPLSVLALSLSARADTGEDLAALREFGRMLVRFVRTQDAACRIGQQSYVLILADTPAQGAARLTERLRLAFDQHPAGGGWTLAIRAETVGADADLTTVTKRLFEFPQAR